MRLNKTTIEGIEPAGKTRLDWDDALPGFGLRTTNKGAKAFIVQARVNGSTRRITLGRVGVLTADQARKRARAELVRMAEGIDPAEEKREYKARRRASKAKQTTLRQVWEEYRLSRRKDGKPRKQSTLNDIESHLRRNFADWVDRPVTDITRDGVLQRHRQIAKRGTYQADQAMRYLRALLNFARDIYTEPDGTPYLPNNPVDVLRSARSWHSPQRRRHVVASDRLGATVTALEQVALDPAELPVVQTEADLLLFILFTGLRIGEASALKWQSVGSGIITLDDPKNRKPTNLPLSDEAAAVLQRRWHDSEYVFAGRSDGHIKDTRGVRDRVADAAGAPFTNHDLRRTFISVAEAHDIGEYTLKQLLNHAVSAADVTGGYIVPGFERLRSAANRVGASIRARADAATTDKVVALEWRS